MKHKNAPGDGGGGPAAQLTDIHPCAHVNVRRAQVALVAGRSLVWFRDRPAHRAMQRMVTLRSSGPAEPCLGERKCWSRQMGAGGWHPLLPSAWVKGIGTGTGSTDKS